MALSTSYTYRVGGASATPRLELRTTITETAVDLAKNQSTVTIKAEVSNDKLSSNYYPVWGWEYQDANGGHYGTGAYCQHNDAVSSIFFGSCGALTKTATSGFVTLWTRTITVPHDDVNGKIQIRPSARCGTDSTNGTTYYGSWLALTTVVNTPAKPKCIVGYVTGNGARTITTATGAKTPGQTAAPTQIEIQQQANTGAWTNITTTLAIGTTAGSVDYAHTPAANSKIQYRSRAKNSAGTSAYSDPSQPTYTTCATLASLVAARSTFTPTAISLSWPASGPYEGQQIKIQRRTGSGAWTDVATVDRADGVYANTGLAAGTQYEYQAQVLDPRGENASGWLASNSVPPYVAATPEDWTLMQLSYDNLRPDARRATVFTTAADMASFAAPDGALAYLSADKTLYVRRAGAWVALDYSSNSLPVTAIGASTNLNSCTDPGLYICTANATAATLTNCPTTSAFYMLVEGNGNPASVGVKQTITTYQTASTVQWFRTVYTNTWGPWTEIFTGNSAWFKRDTTKPTLSGVASGWTVSIGTAIRQYGRCIIYASANPTAAPSTGNIADISLCTIQDGWRPATLANGRINNVNAGLSLATNGALTITDIQNAWGAGSAYSFVLDYLLA